MFPFYMPAGDGETMNHKQLANHVVDRLDHIRDTDPACIAALGAFADVTLQLETENPALFRQLDAAYARALSALAAAVWRDGWECGQSPARLVYAQPQPSAEPVPFEWVTVAEGVCIGLTADQAISGMLNGGAA